jgi:hypothetical protein
LRELLRHGAKNKLSFYKRELLWNNFSGGGAAKIDNKEMSDKQQNYMSEACGVFQLYNMYESRHYTGSCFF